MKTDNAILAEHEQGLLNTPQAAQYLNVSESYVRKRVAAREIPFIRVGTRTLFRRSDLNGWIESRVVATTEELDRRAESRTIALRQGGARR